MRHPYHLVDESPWPLFSSLAAFLLTLNLVKWFSMSNFLFLLMSLTFLILVMAQWWMDISKESTNLGCHNKIVELGLRWGMILFIISEIFFFISFFWAFFHNSLSPAIELGNFWPPQGILVFNPFQVPLLNTLVLISSGISVTWAHHSLMAGNHLSSLQGLFITIMLGAYFSILQLVEYYEASFSISDSIYGSSFFIATGFHGVHVLVGTSFLLVCYLRMKYFSFSKIHHFGFEAAAWYWHFVDVVWLFLFITIYWWGGNL